MLCFVVVMQSFIMNSHEVFIHIHQGCFAGTGAIVRLPQCQWSKPDGYGKISQCITTTKHSKAKTVCIFLGIYCSMWLGAELATSHNWNYCIVISTLLTCWRYSFHIRQTLHINWVIQCDYWEIVALIKHLYSSWSCSPEIITIFFTIEVHFLTSINGITTFIAHVDNYLHNEQNRSIYIKIN